MSPHAMSTLVSDLVEMARAVEMLPQVQAELDRAKEQMHEDGDRIARLETRLMDRAEEINTLNARIRSLEVERDDASFRQLEAEDKVAVAKHQFGNLQAALRDFEMTLSPPEPEPQPEPSPANAQVESSWINPGQSVTTPTEHSYPSDGGTGTGEVSKPEPGQSEPGPTVSYQASGESGTESSGSSLNSSPQGKYSGKKYYDWPYPVSEEGWLDGGGTLEDYWAKRPDVA